MRGFPRRFVSGRTLVSAGCVSAKAFSLGTRVSSPTQVRSRIYARRGVVWVGRPALALECSGGACSPRTLQGALLPHRLGLALGRGQGWGGPLDEHLRQTATPAWQVPVPPAE